MKIFFKRADGTLRIQYRFDGPTKTQQQFKDQCDVNNIIRKYNQTNEITHLARTRGVYADISTIGDYADSLTKVMSAQEAFLTLPATVRRDFSNDPGQLLSFMKDPANFEKCVEYGLFEKPIVPNVNNDFNDDGNKAKASKTVKDSTTKVSKGSTPPQTHSGGE